MFGGGELECHAMGQPEKVLVSRTPVLLLLVTSVPGGRMLSAHLNDNFITQSLGKSVILRVVFPHLCKRGKYENMLAERCGWLSPVPRGS